MAIALLVTRDEVVKFTALNGNTDTDKFIQFVKIAQDTHIQNYLGTKLFDKINAGIIADDLTSDYTTLLNTYIKPMTIHWAMVEYLPFAAYTIGNKGVYKHGSESSENVDKSEIDFLVEKQRSIAEHYTRRFLDFICYEQSKYPEYNTNSNGDMYPDKSAEFSGWYL
jgi:hypothetical protein